MPCAHQQLMAPAIVKVDDIWQGQQPSALPLEVCCDQHSLDMAEVLISQGAVSHMV